MNKQAAVKLLARTAMGMTKQAGGALPAGTVRGAMGGIFNKLFNSNATKAMNDQYADRFARAVKKLRGPSGTNAFSQDALRNEFLNNQNLFDKLKFGFNKQHLNTRIGEGVLAGGVVGASAVPFFGDSGTGNEYSDALIKHISEHKLEYGIGGATLGLAATLAAANRK